jgi:hypothetical protein
MYIFILPLAEEHERTLSFVQMSKAEVLSSAGPVGILTAKEIYEDRKGAIEEASGVCRALVQGRWPVNSEEFCQALCDEPKSVLDWRRRNFLMLAVAKNMVFVADDKTSSSELFTLLTVARIVRANTLGIVTAGSIPFSIPSTILSAADLILSGEADSTTAQRVLRSLTQEG